jgi:large subunit ribosomal protein L22
VDLVRGKGVDEAINILTFTRRAASEPVRKLIESAMANAEAKGTDIDRLYVDTITVDEDQPSVVSVPGLWVELLE